MSVTATDLAGNVGSAATGSFVYDIANPSVSSVGYYDSLTGGSVLSTVVGSDDIYTRVVFSEAVTDIAGSGAGAVLPEIAYRTGSGGTEAVYSIVASGATLASGECKEVGTGASDGKAVHLSVPDERDSGTGGFKSYVKRYADRSFNFGSGQSYGSLAGSVAIAAGTARGTDCGSEDAGIVAGE